MKDSKQIAHIIGQVLAIVVIACIAVCLCGLAVGLTLKFLSLIF